MEFPWPWAKLATSYYGYVVTVMTLCDPCLSGAGGASAASSGESAGDGGCGGGGPDVSGSPASSGSVEEGV